MPDRGGPRGGGHGGGGGGGRYANIGSFGGGVGAPPGAGPFGPPPQHGGPAMSMPLGGGGGGYGMGGAAQVRHQLMPHSKSQHDLRNDPAASQQVPCFRLQMVAEALLQQLQVMTASVCRVLAAWAACRQQHRRALAAAWLAAAQRQGPWAPRHLRNPLSGVTTAWIRCTGYTRWQQCSTHHILLHGYPA